MRKYVFLAILIAALPYLFIPSGDDTKEIEAVLSEIEEAGEKMDLDGVMNHFSLRYRDEYGATCPVVKNILKRLFDKLDNVKGEYSNLTASISESAEGEKEAVANMDVYVTTSGSENFPVYILGSEESPQNITVTFRKSKFGDWQIVKVEGLDQRFEKRFR